MRVYYVCERRLYLHSRSSGVRFSCERSRRHRDIYMHANMRLARASVVQCTANNGIHLVDYTRGISSIYYGTSENCAELRASDRESRQRR